MAASQPEPGDNSCLPGENDPTTDGPSKRDAVLSLGILAFAVILAVWLIPAYVLDYGTGDRGLSPRFFPYLICGGLALLALILFNRHRRALFGGHSAATDDDSPKTDLFVIICAALLLVYYLAVFLLGMLPASFLALIGLMLLFGFRFWWKIIVFSAVLVSLLFVFFEKVALVLLPRGLWFDGLY